MAAPTTETRPDAAQNASPAPEQNHPSEPRKGSGRRILRLIILLALVAVVALLVWKLFFASPKPPDNLVVLSGRIEGDDSAVSPKTSGRILEMHFREGDTVKAGEIIATLDDRQVRAREQQSEAALLQAEAQLRSAQQQVAIMREQLGQSEIETTQATSDAAGRVRQAEAEVAAAEAELAQQQATLQLAVFDKDAYGRLAKSGAVPERQGRQAASSAAAQQAVVEASGRKLEAARGSLNVAKSSLANTSIRNAQSAGIRKQMVQQQSQIANAAADEQRARAQLEEARADRQDLTVRAPFDGTIVTRAAEPGEVLQAGTAVVTMLDLHKVYLRGFVPEGQIGKVRVGQAAHVYLDSDPSKPLDAYVSRVDPQATFTPENTYFRDDRVKQVVGVKLQLRQALGYAKPGMPADGEILTAGDKWPEWRRQK